MHLGLWSTQTSQVVFSGNSPTSQACFNNQRSWLLKGEAKKKKKKVPLLYSILWGLP